MLSLNPFALGVLKRCLQKPNPVDTCISQIILIGVILTSASATQKAILSRNSHQSIGQSLVLAASGTICVTAFISFCYAELVRSRSANIPGSFRVLTSVLSVVNLMAGIHDIGRGAHLLAILKYTGSGITLCQGVRQYLG